MAGTFASIEKQLSSDGEGFVAVKKYANNHGTLVLRHYQRELWALQKLALVSLDEASKHHILFLMKTESTATSNSLTFPFYEYTLASRMTTKDRCFALNVLQQIAQGLSFLHSHDIIHCDLSPSNILMGDRDQLVISDFGCAHLSSVEGHDDGIDEIGTRFYKAPEHLFGYRVYTAATDVWSLGVIFLELLSGTYLFPGGSDLEQIGMIKRALGSPSKSVINEEMNQYPDANKLIFFNGDGKDDTDTDEDEEYEEDEEERLHTLNYILDTSHILTDHQTFIRRILTWSIKNRISIEEILAFVEHENS